MIPAMGTGRRRVLLVEDETGIVEPVVAALEREGFAPVVAGTLEDARGAFDAEAPDIVLLDVNLPDGSGFDFCREVRRAGDVPVIMVTARGDEMDRIIGLEIGADDYVVKPFSARELVARVRAVLRRFEATARQADQPAGGGAVEVGGVRLDTARRQVTLDGEPVELSRKEYELLALLMRHAGAVVTREQAIEEVWDTNWFGSTKTLDVHISGLRKKLGDDPAAPAYIHTARGVGFRFAGPDEFSAGAGTP
ncbi:MAG: response regulator transcription factor [Thermoleophilia bacterium]